VSNRFSRQVEAEITKAEIPSMLTPAPLLVDGKTAARLLGIGVSCFYAMDRSGELGPRGVRLRRRRLWSYEELAAWTRSGCPRREEWTAIWESEKTPLTAHRPGNLSMYRPT